MVPDYIHAPANPERRLAPPNLEQHFFNARRVASFFLDKNGPKNRGFAELTTSAEKKIKMTGVLKAAGFLRPTCGSIPKVREAGSCGTFWPALLRNFHLVGTPLINPMPLGYIILSALWWMLMLHVQSAWKNLRRITKIFNQVVPDCSRASRNPGQLSLKPVNFRF